jgi:AcrR family transcriptional regulator
MNKDKDTKGKVIDVACELFAKQGYDGVSIRTIAKEAGVNLSAVNYHFRNKAMLYGQILHDARNKLSAHVVSLESADKSTLELAMGVYDIYLEHSQLLRHTFSMLLSDVSYELQEKDKVDDVGPPGESVIMASIRREFGEDIELRAVEWAIGSIFSQITHVALISGTPLMKQLCTRHGERFNPTRFRQNVEHSIRGNLMYLKSHHADI